MKFVRGIYNTLPVAALGAADLHGLRPHAAGPQFHENYKYMRERVEKVHGRLHGVVLACLY